MRTPDVSKIPLKWLVALGLAVVVISFMVGYLRRPVPLQEHARILFQAILEEDGATILRYVHPVERELNDLTPETTTALVSEMINARYEAWGWTPEAESVSFAADPHHHSGIATQMGRIPGVGRVPRSAQVWRMERGRPTILLSETIAAMYAKERTWELRRQGQSRRAVHADPSLLARSWLEGLDRNERRLRELGVRYDAGVNRDAGVVRFISLDDLRKVLLDWLADPAALKRPNPYESHPFQERHAGYWMSADEAREHKRQRAQGR